MEGSDDFQNGTRIAGEKEIELKDIQDDSSLPTGVTSLEDITDFDDAASAVTTDEEEKQAERSSLKKLISTLLTVIALLFGGAGALYGIEGKHEQRETGTIDEWKYLNCVYFCVVTLTTIGYGDISPKTPGGKVFVVFYAIISLGVMAAAITSIGQVIVVRANKQKNDFLKVGKTLNKKLRKMANLQTQPTEKDLQDAVKREIEAKKKASFKRFIFRLVGLLALIAIAILVGARVFSAFEGWRYGDSVYYCFITLLTIGYGDFYPHTDGGKIFFIFYAFIGLGLIAFVVGDIGEKILSRTQEQLQEAKLQKAFKAKMQFMAKISKFPKDIGKINPLNFTKGKKQAEEVSGGENKENPSQEKGKEVTN